MMDFLELSTLLFDFGLVVLIWMTQLIVYPSFAYFQPDDLVRWHSRYTSQVTLVVMPLMLAQLVLHVIGLYESTTFWQVGAALLIVLTWINTFFFAVPLHQKIAAGQRVSQSANSLVKVNWFRTISWTIIFLIGLMRFLRS